MPNNYSLENANVILDGNSQAGQVSEVELPELEWEMIDRENLGDIGLIQYPAKLGELECTLTLTDFSPALVRAAADYQTVHQLQIRANLGEHSSQGKLGDRLLKIDLRGRFIQNSLGTISPNEPMDIELMMKVDYIKETFNDEVILELDVQQPKYRVNGVDLLAGMRANLGLN